MSLYVCKCLNVGVHAYINLNMVLNKSHVNGYVCFNYEKEFLINRQKRKIQISKVNN